jgi:hypothetical protein
MKKNNNFYPSYKTADVAIEMGLVASVMVFVPDYFCFNVKISAWIALDTVFGEAKLVELLGLC